MNHLKHKRGLLPVRMSRLIKKVRGGQMLAFPVKYSEEQREEYYSKKEPIIEESVSSGKGMKKVKNIKPLHLKFSNVTI